MTGVADLVREEYRTAMLYDDMTVDRIMEYATSIEEYKLKKIPRNLISSGYSDNEETRLTRVLNLKKSLGALRSKLRKVVVLKMKSLHV